MSIWDSRGLLIYCCVVSALLGAVFGSFLSRPEPLYGLRARARCG